MQRCGQTGYADFDAEHEWMLHHGQPKTQSVLHAKIKHLNEVAVGRSLSN